MSEGRNKNAAISEEITCEVRRGICKGIEYPFKYLNFQDSSVIKSQVFLRTKIKIYQIFVN